MKILLQMIASLALLLSVPAQAIVGGGAPSTEGVEETLDSLDGLIFSGGSDLDPGLYGQEAHAETRDVVRGRDDAELALLRAALERDLPVLAICRGSQVLNVALGGDLVQHLPDVVGDATHKQTPGVFADHEVELESGTRLGGLLGERAVTQGWATRQELEQIAEALIAWGEAPDAFYARPVFTALGWA